MRITRDPRFELRMVLFWVTVFAVWLFGFIFPLGNILWPKTFVSGLFAFSYVWLTFWTSSTLVTYVVGSFTSPRLLTEVDLTPESPTAIICPVKSEDVGLLLARLADTLTGNPGPHVHFWLLSDSPEEDQEAERELIRKLRRRFAKRRIFYRRRKSPAHLKQGNVREWVMRYGHRSYEFFLVLDADSVIPRGALHQLLRKAAHPDNQDVFIFQAAIRISNVASRFTRLANIGIRIVAGEQPIPELRTQPPGPHERLVEGRSPGLANGKEP
jgi:membrane glycosyltransferase